MWKCKNCSEQIDNDFDSCWNCSYSRNGSPPQETNAATSEPVLPNGELLSQIAASHATTRSRTAIAEALTRRYIDAYASARWRIRIGGIIKWLAVALAIVIVFVGMIASGAFGDRGPVVGFFVACILGVPIYILGILMSGQGQIQLATLDTAVNTSRHLSKDEVAEILFG